VAQGLPFVLVSGLAASGKSSVARPLAEELRVPLVSKDAIKEALYDVVGYGSWTWSKTLSRAADAALVRIAQDLEAAVLDNYWHADTVDELLSPLPRPLVEVFCRCDPEVAFARFTVRRRHPGHADDEIAPTVTRDWMHKAAATFPLGTLGPVVEVDAERPVDVGSVAARVRAAGASA
jgi:thymidylate kinase